MKPLKLIATATLAFSIAMAGNSIVPLSASAAPAAVQVAISTLPSVNPGSAVTIKGTSNSSEVILKVIRPTGSILFYDIVKVTDGTFTDTFTLGTGELAGTYKVVAGQADTVDTKDLVVTVPVITPIDPSPTPSPTPEPTPIPGGGGGGGIPTAPSTGSPNVIEISASALTANKVTGPDGKVKTTVTIANQALIDAIAKLKAQEGSTGVPTISVAIANVEVNGTTDVSLPAVLVAEALKSLPNVVILIHSNNETYTLPLRVLDLDAIAKNLGSDLSSITLHIAIGVVSSDLEKQIQESAAKKGANSLGHSVTFLVTAEGKGRTQELDSFGSTYVDRSIVYTGALDAKTSTGVLYDPVTREISFVPTYFVKNTDGTTQAHLKRNGNSIYAVVTSSKTFNDIKGYWAQADIELLASKLVVSGTTSSTFAPENQITRAEFAALLVRALALPADSAAATFKDVKANDWYAGSVGAAAKAKLVSGYEDGTFKPNAPITREQMAVMVARALSAAGQTVDGQPDLLNKFTDSAKISDWAKTSVSQSVKAGIISGMTANTFVPAANASRAQAVVMLKRLLEYAQFIN